MDRLEDMGVPVMPSIAIVGAGWAGLAAAVRLADAGCQVTLFESAKQAGGRARTVVWNGTAIDNGQHLLVGAYSATLAIMTQVGIDTANALRRIPLTLEVPGRLSLQLPKLPAPLHLAFGLLGARGATLQEKFSAARFMHKLETAKFRLANDTTVADWLDLNQQHGALRTHLWESLCLAALNTHARDASAQVFANVLRDTLGASRKATDMLLPATDLGQLFPEAALRRLKAAGGNIHFGRRVTRLSRPAAQGASKPANVSGWQIDAGGESVQVDHVVLATAAQHLAALLPKTPELDDLNSTIAAYQWEPIATAYLQYPANQTLTAPLIAISREPAQWLADRGQLGGPKGLFAHVLSGHGDWEKLNNDELVMALHRATNEVIRRQHGELPLPTPKSHCIIREKRATFRCTVGLSRPSTATPLAGLWLAGDHVACDYPGTLEAAVRSGEAAASAILQSQEAKPRQR